MGYIFLTIPYLLFVLILYLADLPLAAVIGVPTAFFSFFLLHPWLDKRSTRYRNFSKNFEELAPRLGAVLIATWILLGLIKSCSDGWPDRCTPAEARFDIC